MAGTCDVCGAPSGQYPICLKCNTLKKEGKVAKCDSCGKWYLGLGGCLCKQTPSTPPADPSETHERKGDSDKICFVCGADSSKGPLCLECYRKKELVKKEFEKERTRQQVLDHYFAQKSMLYRIKDTSYIENGVLRLIAIAEELSLLHRDPYLRDRLDTDIKALLQRKVVPQEKTKEETAPSKESVKKSFDDEDYRKQWLAEHQCDDGHYVRSYSELLIDNWLYNNGYVHAYEKSVFMITDPDAVVLSDFYLPGGDVYIEFWGLNDDQRYLDRKAKKIKMYTENNLNLISLEEADVKRLNDIMPRKLFPFIKK